MRTRLALLILLLGGQFPWTGTAELESPENLLIFQNGDQLTGEHLETTAEGIIRFETPYLGVIEVPREQAQVIHYDLNTRDPKTDELINEKTTEVAIEESYQDNLMALEESGSEEREDGQAESSQWDRTEVPGLFWIRYPRNWEGRLRFSFVSLEGETSDFRFNFDNSLIIPRKFDEFEIQTRYDYETTRDGDLVTRDRYDAQLRYDRDISEHRFFQSVSFYGADQIKLINEEIRQSIGYGILWNGSKKYEVQLVPGISGSFLDQDNSSVDDDWVFLGRIFQSFTYQFSEDYSINQSLEGFVEAENPENYKLNFRVGLIGALTQKLAVELDYEYDLDNTLANQIDEAESRFRANLIFKY